MPKKFTKIQQKNYDKRLCKDIINKCKKLFMGSGAMTAKDYMAIEAIIKRTMKRLE